MKKIKLLLLTFISSLLVISCLVDDNVKDGQFSNSPYAVGFRSANASYIYTDLDTEIATESTSVDLIGGNNGIASNEDIIITFEVDASSTAIEGQQYTLTNNTGTIVIPKGQDFISFPFTINPNNLPANQPKTIKINLTGVTSPNGIIVDANRTITIVIAKCASNLAGNYSLQVTRNNGAVYDFPNEVITQIGFNEYVTSTTANYTLPILQADYPDIQRAGFTFKDVCQTIQIDEQNLADYFTNLVYGNNIGDGTNGSVTLDTNGEVVSITLEYTVTFESGNRSYTAVYTKL